MCSYHSVVMPQLPQCGKNTHPKITQETQCGKDMPFQISNIFKITPHCLPYCVSTSLPYCGTHSQPHCGKCHIVYHIVCHTVLHIVCHTVLLPQECHTLSQEYHTALPQEYHITTAIPHSNTSYYHMNTIALPYTSATCCYMQFS